ncbi:hypothetical protein PVL29_008265 [Vitis rotundifolia]|uniref:DUF1279 domain-containing protein n=1 Tax=Vitis rotundifolia TaxID=103349 RepID=A0AA39A2E0_VITRO|nr:hypothetical protein PVL29_008265 [Vitis rotundifolia]
MAGALLGTCFSSASLSINTREFRIGSSASTPPSKPNFTCFRVRAIKEKTEEIRTPSPSPSSSPSAQEITEKFGLEAGLWKIFSSKDEEKEGGKREKSKGEEAKELLTKYGGAYLATSITLSLISFSLCYALINAGVDVQALLQKVLELQTLSFLHTKIIGLGAMVLIAELQVGISVDATGEKVGTFALAYAAHKAASPIRFPPTVALTPIVASWIGKKVDKEN